MDVIGINSLYESLKVIYNIEVILDNFKSFFNYGFLSWFVEKTVFLDFFLLFVFIVRVGIYDFSYVYGSWGSNL